MRNREVIEMKILKKIRGFFYGKDRYINGTKGVISLFLALLLIPFTMIAGSLVNAARVDSAVAIFDEALCNSSNSTLGTYDSFLRERFGLLAISQNTSGRGEGYTVNDLISETFDYYMEQNLGALSNTYVSSESNVTGVYPLANKDVLLYQVLEYSKYTVPAKLVSDGLSINDIIASFENRFPGSRVLDLITSGTGAAESLMDLGTHIEELKDAIDDEVEKTSTYNSAYIDFESEVSNYVDTKTEMESELARIQGEIDTAQSLITQYTTQVSSLEGQISPLETQLTNLTQQKTSKETQKAAATDADTISALEAEISSLESQITTLTTQINTLKSSLSIAKSNLETQKTAKSTAETKYATTKTSYENMLAEIKVDIDTEKAEYSASISELISALEESYDKVTAVQGDITDVSSAAANVVTNVTTNAIAGATEDNDESIEKLEEQLNKAETEEAKQAIQQQITELKETNTSLENQKTVAEALQSGYDDAMSTIKDDFTSINTQRYQDYISTLMILKQNVDSYNTSNIQSKLVSSNYYIGITDLMTKEDVEAAEDNLMAELASESLWAVLKAITGFIKALLNISLVYDPELSALIDTGYYNDTYGGLPSEKDRTVYPLSNGEAGDAALSQHYRDLFGDYGNADNDLLGDVDIWELLQRIFTDIGVITAGVGSITTGMILLNFAETLTSIMDAVEDLKLCINKAVEFVQDAIASIGNKVLLSGYVSYMTSNRTTYTENALNGTEFNLRGQSSPTTLGVPVVDDFLALFNTITGAVEGDTEKCFVGAETEYIMFGFSSEIGNQAAAFGSTYLIRVLADVLTIVKDPEVASIAAACTIASPVVYVLYIFLEPLVDTLILVNGESIPIIKTYVYLTPRGLESLIGKITSLGLNSAQMDEAKVKFTEKIGASKYAEMQEVFGTSVSVEEGSGLVNSEFFNVDYTQTLFLMMTIFTSSDKMLDRLSNIIEMEAVEYMNNQVVTNGKFDLDHSYTYIRAEAKFSMSEFIKISDDAGIDAKKRIIYRGY